VVYQPERKSVSQSPHYCNASTITPDSSRKKQVPQWGQKPRHTLLGRALEAFQTGQSARGCAALRRLTPTKHTAGPLATIFIVSRPEIG